MDDRLDDEKWREPAIAPPYERNILGALEEGTDITIFCQRRGDRVTDRGYSSSVWDSVEATDGSGRWGWVSDLYVNTPNIDEYTPGISVCTAPGP
jgi:hypothetical protein